MDETERDFSEGWAWVEPSRLDSESRDDRSTSAYDPFPGEGDWVWQPYGARDKALASGSSSVVASSIDVTRFGAAVRRDDPSPLLDVGFRWLLWSWLEPLLAPSERPRTTLGFTRDTVGLTHNGRTIGGSSLLTIFHPDTRSYSDDSGGGSGGEGGKVPLSLGGLGPPASTLESGDSINLGGLVVAASFNRAAQYRAYDAVEMTWSSEDLPNWRARLVRALRALELAPIWATTTANLDDRYA